MPQTDGAAGCAGREAAGAGWQGGGMPRSDSAANGALDRLVLGWIARAHGDEGYYRTTASLDPEVLAARALRPRTDAILHPGPR